MEKHEHIELYANKVGCPRPVGGLHEFNTLCPPPRGCLLLLQIGPFANPSETYQYYNLPFCLPKGGMTFKREGLGEVLEGGLCRHLLLIMGTSDRCCWGCLGGMQPSLLLRWPRFGLQRLKPLTGKAVKGQATALVQTFDASE